MNFRVMSVPSTGFTQRLSQYKNFNITLLKKKLYATYCSKLAYYYGLVAAYLNIDPHGLI